MPYRYDVEIVGLLASPEHRYDGRPGDAVPPQDGDRREVLIVRGGAGIVGDRYSGRPAHRDAQVTVLAAEGIESLADRLHVQRVRRHAADRRADGCRRDGRLRPPLTVHSRCLDLALRAAG